MAWTKFKRIEDSANIDSIDVEDGAFIVTKDGKSYTDFDNERVPIAGTPDDEMDDTSRNTVENKVIKEYVDNNFTPKGKILWTNLNPTSNFASQTITLDESLDNYDMYEVLCLQSTTNPRVLSTGKIPVGHGAFITVVSGQPRFRPTGTTVSGDTISFENCQQLTAIGSSTIANEQLIPMYVIGYNTGLFE